MAFIEMCQEYDYKYSKAISLYNGLYGPKTFQILRVILKLLEWSGHGIPWIIFAVWGTCRTISTNERLSFIRLLFGLFIDLVVIAILKLTFKRLRPEYNEGDLPLSASKIDGFSFPSGHATRALMIFVFAAHTIKNPLYHSYVAIWAVALCISRVALGRHFITDVLVGSIVGLGEGLYVVYFPLENILEFTQNVLYY